MSDKPHILKRSCMTASATITWVGTAWDDLTADQRNAVRDGLDAAIDVLNGTAVV